jgi:hypothetical protein
MGRGLVGIMVARIGKRLDIKCFWQFAVPASNLAPSDYGLIEVITRCKQHFLITDPLAKDNPIVFASQGFYDLTEYTPEEILGFNCRCVPMFERLPHFLLAVTPLRCVTCATICWGCAQVSARA